MLRDVFQQLLSGSISRRQFLNQLTQLGVGTFAATQLAEVFAAVPESSDQVDLENVTGGRITCETLKLWDVEYVFGNTGAYEAGFVDALVDYEDVHYVLGLHEGSVMAMADGYARASGRTSFVNIHSITGTANALGLIVNAWADSSPVVISVGLSERSGENLGVFTETNKLESIPELYTKLSFRASRIENLGESLRRAFRLASVLPSGPVFLGVPSDVWAGRTEKTSLIPASRTVSASRIQPDGNAVDQAAQWLVEANNPLLIAGAELPRWGGLSELATISDQLGAAVSRYGIEPFLDGIPERPSEIPRRDAWTDRERRPVRRGPGCRSEPTFAVEKGASTDSDGSEDHRDRIEGRTPRSQLSRRPVDLCACRGNACPRIRRDPGT
jgi:benzoylformate decarboxylase